MQIFTKLGNISKGAAVSGTTLALLAAPGAAFANGTGSNTNANNGPSSRQNQRSASFNDWFNRNRHRQQLTCDQRQDALNKQAAAVKDKDLKRLTGLNIVFSGVQTYVESGGVTVDNYDTMKTQVTTDQTNATNAINGITAPQLNCNDQNSAAAVSDDSKTFKHDNDNMNSTINAAQQALNAYRKDSNNLFEAAINS